MNDEGPEQNSHGDVAGHAKSDGRDQPPSEVGIVGRSGSQDAFHRPLAEAFPVRGALHRMGIGHPLRDGPSHARDDADVRANGATFEDQPPVTKGVLDPLHDATQLPDMGLSNARAFDGQVDNLGDGKQAKGHGHQTNAIPQIEAVKGVALDARDRIESDHGQHEAQPRRREPFDHSRTAEGGDESHPQHGEHKELRGAHRQD